MIPLGYMLKRVAARPDGLVAGTVDDIYAVSDHLSRNFADYIRFWRHNGYWLFDAPETMFVIAVEAAIDLAGMTLFYYEAFEQQFDEATRQWSAFGPEASLPTAVVPPAAKHLHGFDVVTFQAGAGPECSPLSCNALAATLPVNRHCLFSSLDAAKQALEAGAFDNSEPGPFRIIAVHTVASP